MFGGFNRGRLVHRMKNEDKGLPWVSVTFDEFVDLLVRAGKARSEAIEIADRTKIMGAHTRIGDHMVGIV